MDKISKLRMAENLKLYYAIAESVRKIVSAIVRNENTNVITISITT